MKTTSKHELEKPEAPTAVPSFAETAMRLGGKSDDEARRMGAVDAADEQVDELFDARFQTSNSPVHLAVWGKELPTQMFGLTGPPLPPSESASTVMNRSLNVIRRHQESHTLIDHHGKISDAALNELGENGYWGLLVEQKYGGSEAPFSQFASFITQMAMLDPTVAGLASVHACIGAVDPVMTFGNPEQKHRFLPKLASGERLSAFALTEPNAGSDLTALRTTATLAGDHYVLHGEKLFITNVRPGRTVGVVCLIDEKPAVLIVDLPNSECEEFRLKKYGLYALKHAYNQGILFNGLKVPKENLLDPGQGDGLTIAYHGLNRGRVALCANAAGAMRKLLVDMLPWAKFRKTYGEKIAKRELVQRRVGHMAGLIVACDALTDWTAGLLDLGYRGEMECIVAKIFGSEAVKEAAIELSMKTHGGRSFLHGHWFGDNVHDLLAPCIYEGEGEMLGMAFLKSLVKEHGRNYFEEIGQTLHDLNIKQPNFMNPRHLWALKRPVFKYGTWLTSQTIRQHLPGEERSQFRMHVKLHVDDDRTSLGLLQTHYSFAAKFLRQSRLEISAVMRKHQLRLPDRQCRMAELSGRIQTAIVMLVTSLYAAAHHDPNTVVAGEVICAHLKRKLTGKRVSDQELRRITHLGDKIANGEWVALKGTQPDAILMPYE